MKPRLAIGAFLAAIAAEALAALVMIAAEPAKADACGYLTKSEVARIQRASVQETKTSARESDGFAILDCFYRVEPFDRSISLELTRRGTGASAHDPRARWEKMFADGEERDETHRPEKGEKETPPHPVGGVGDAAFWISNPVSGALYALKGNSYLRVSVGGPDPEPIKIEKASELARVALARLGATGLK
ncbi:MAG TPA: hypothetical protein VJA66_05810 [Thermoanaerobaculia bacterium]